MASVMRVRLVAAWCVLVAALPVAGAIVEASVPPAAGAGEDRWYVALGLVGLALMMAALAALLLIRKPENRVGWLFATAVSAITYSTFATTYAQVSSASAHPLVGVSYVAWASTWLMPFVLWLCIILLLLTFPDGRLPSRRWRPVLLFTFALFGVNIVAAMVRPGALDESGGIANPLGWETAGPAVEMIGTVFWPLASLLSMVSASSLVVRYRFASGMQRQQLKWLATSGVLIVTGGLLAFAAGNVLEGNNGSVLGTVASFLVGGGLVSVPVFAALAILRYRLYDLDRIVSRTLSYALLTGLLAVLYGTVVFLCLGILTVVYGADSKVSVAIATLAVSAAFRPARKRVQALVDRRFNRARYDAEVTVRTFAERMREPFDVDDVRADLLATTAGVVNPSLVQVSILPPRSRAGGAPA